ncbi:hypothetical protein [Sinomicrobium sp. M5D2P9]
MKNAKNVFHRISYLQYLLYAIALFFLLKIYYDIFFVEDKDSVFSDVNKGLMFLGLGISFCSLQDTGKTQNNFSKRIWESSKKGKVALIVLSLEVLFFLLLGLSGLFISKNELLQEVSMGLIVLGIGMIGILKVAIEMHENHRKS